MMDKHSSHHTYCGILLSDEKEETTAPCYSIDDSQNDYAEQKKSDTEEQVLYVDAFMWNESSASRLLVTWD